MSLLAAAGPASLTPLWVIAGYMGLLLLLGLIVKQLFRGSSNDYFVASRSIGPFLLLMSVFGTTMTAFALVGSTGKSYDLGIGVYGLMASSSGLIHSLVFFLIGIKLWAIGKRYGYVTQIQYFRDRFESSAFGYLLFPILVLLVIPYLLIGLLGAGAVVGGVTRGMFPDTFDGGSVPPSITGAVICGVVLFYIFLGGLRGAAWANAFQTMVFMVTGVIAFYLIAMRLGETYGDGGGLLASLKVASEQALAKSPEHVMREGKIGHLQFLTYMLVPLSVGMFPHLFQHWLTARSAKTFRLSIVCHPLFIMIVWVPCILIGIWAVGHGLGDRGIPPNKVLGVMVGSVLKSPFLTGLLTAGILAAIMSSLDSQFVCLGTIFTHDIVLHSVKKDRFTDLQKILIGRVFIVLVVVVTYVLSLLKPPHIFDLAVWCFSGFASLFPLVVAAVYWKRATKAGAFACVLAMTGTWAFLFHRGLVQPILEGVETKGDYLIGGMMPVAVIFAVSTVALVVVSLVTQPPSDATVKKFFPTQKAA